MQEQIDALKKKQETLEQRVDRLEKLENNLDFLTWDNTAKIAIAEGLSSSNHNEIVQIKIDVHQIQQDISQINTKLDEQKDMLDQILGFLKPRG